MSSDFPSWVPTAGSEGEPFSIVIESGKVAEFAVAVGTESGLGVPPTFLEVARLWRGPDASPWTMDPDVHARTLHASQEYELFAGPLRPGLELTGRMRIDKVYEKSGKRSGRMIFVEVVTDFADGSGAVLARARQTTVTTERPPDKGA